MRLWKKVVVGALAVVVGVPVLFVATINASAWYYRGRAIKLLAVLKNVRPGVTTEAEYLRAVAPLDTHMAAALSAEPKDAVVPGEIDIGNWPTWMWKRLYLCYPAVTWLTEHRIVPDPAEFFVVPEFSGGLVSRLMVHEWQGNGRPFGGSVRIMAIGFERANDLTVAPPFAGYSVRQRHLEDGTLWYSFVGLDERATTEERSRALDFSFRCFTDLGSCGDGGKMLQPAPNRPGFDPNP